MLQLCMVMAIILTAHSCATPGANTSRDEAWSTAIGQGPVGATHTSDPGSAAKDLAVARRMVNTGEFSLVIPRLQQIVSNYPAAQAAIEARYYLGRSYYAVGAYNDALRYLDEYIDLAPDGEHVDAGRELLARLTDRVDTPDASELETQVARLRELIVAEPDNMAPQLELANLLWEQGHYQQSGILYGELLERWPGLESDMAIRRRVERDTAGRLIVLTPQEVERRYRESEPLVIYNVSSFRSGRFEGWPATAHERYYNVTGQAVNQSARSLQDVRVIVTIYGFGHMVYDTQTVNLGGLRPGEARAFSVQFSRFDDIHNVTRHECVGTFRR
jgi:tetratricopeptide (TPR) repeat protein